MVMQILLFLTNIILINVAFLLAFLIRYGTNIPEVNFQPYKDNFAFLTFIYMLGFYFFGLYRKRFRSFWDIFKRVFTGLFLGTLFGIALVYVFRIKWSSFPSSIFVISFPVGLFVIFTLNSLVLRFAGRIKKKIVIIGQEKNEGLLKNSPYIEKQEVKNIEDLIKYKDVDEIIICEKITNAKDLNLLLYLEQKSKAQILFSPSVYVGLLPERINGNSSIELLSTFVGRQSDLDEFFIALLDISTSLILLILATVPMLIISILIKLTSRGTVIYKQQRVGKDGRLFTLYKFRTMVKDAEGAVGPVWASRDDPRVTKVGRVLRTTRLDELPQLFNILRGDMSLVGPRPERSHFVKQHKALREMRLAVKPGLTGLAQVRSFYDLKPQHKIKYDYLYIQRRSLLLNLYILAKTIPVIFSKKGR